MKENESVPEAVCLRHAYFFWRDAVIRPDGAGREGNKGLDAARRARAAGA